MKSQKSQVPKKVTHGEVAGQILTARLANSTRAPREIRHVMKKMASGPEAAAVWKVFGSDDDTVGHVTDLVRQALEGALKEIQRPPAKKEREDIERVIKLASELKEAIKASSLPGNWCRNDFADLSAVWGPDIELSVGWHSLSKELDWQGYPLAICDVLDWAGELASQHLNSLPARAVARKSTTRMREGTYPEVPAFVRLLAWHFHRNFKQERRGTIAHVANAIFDLEEGHMLNSAVVEGYLKDRRTPLLPPHVAEEIPPLRRDLGKPTWADTILSWNAGGEG